MDDNSGVGGGDQYKSVRAQSIRQSYELRENLWLISEWILNKEFIQNKTFLKYDEFFLLLSINCRIYLFSV